MGPLLLSKNIWIVRNPPAAPRFHTGSDAALPVLAEAAGQQAVFRRADCLMGLLGLRPAQALSRTGWAGNPGYWFWSSPWHKDALCNRTSLPAEIVTAIEDCGFFESIPLWAVTLIGGLFIWVLSFVMILSVYGRFFKMFMYAALAPIPLSSFAGEPSQNVGKSFLKSYAAVCLEGAVIVLACIIFSVFASSPPAVDPDAAAASMVWSYIGELIFKSLFNIF